MRKILVIDEQNDQLLTKICDAAFKAMGIQILGTVNQLVSKIHEEPDICSGPIEMITA